MVFTVNLIPNASEEHIFSGLCKACCSSLITQPSTPHALLDTQRPSTNTQPLAYSFITQQSHDYGLYENLPTEKHNVGCQT